MPDLVNLIKQVAVEANEATEPSTIVFGSVTSTSPLGIFVDQKLTLTSDFLILTKNVMDYNIEIDIDVETDRVKDHAHTFKDNTDKDSTDTSLQVDNKTDEAGEHKHSIKCKKTFTIHNGLKKGDKVIMIKQAGGQNYVVLDKLGGA